MHVDFIESSIVNSDKQMPVKEKNKFEKKMKEFISGHRSSLYSNIMASHQSHTG